MWYCITLTLAIAAVVVGTFGRQATHVEPNTRNGEGITIVWRPGFSIHLEEDVPGYGLFRIRRLSIEAGGS
jgi:hypothetical protein